MSSLDEMLGVEAQPVNLSEIVGTDLPTATLPKAAVRNRAATTALMSGGDASKAVDNYQIMVAEGDQGNSHIVDQLQTHIMDQAEQEDKQSFMSVLSDPAIPYERKGQLIKNMREDPVRRDLGMKLLTDNLSAGSAGETQEAEDARVNATGNALKELYESRTLVQGLVNAHAAGLDSVGAKTLVEAATTIILPGAQAATAAGLESALGSSMWKIVKAAVLPGSSIEEKRKALENVPPAQRAELAKKLIGAISQNSNMILPSGNHFDQAQKAQQIFSDGGYSSTEAWMDNITNLLDIVGMGWAFRGAKTSAKGVKVAEIAPEIVQAGKTPNTSVKVNPKVATKTTEVGDLVERIEVNSPIRVANPTSPMETIKGVNPEKARGMHSAIVKSTDDALAEGLAGTSRIQAIANDVMPQAITASGKVTVQATDIQRTLRRELQTPANIHQAIYEGGRIEYTVQEKATALGNITRDFQNAEGMVMNPELGGVKLEGGRVTMSGVYGTPEGAFKDAEQALEQAKYSLRKYGVDESDIEILSKQGLDYVPVKVESVKGVDGSYMVRVNTSKELDATDIVQFEKMDVKLNFADSLPWTQWGDSGSVSRILVDAASMLHPTYTGAAVVAADHGARFEKVIMEGAKNFSDTFKNLSKSERNLVGEYTKEANYKGLAFDAADLIGRGFSNEAIEAVKHWREFWDGHHYLENLDIVRSMRADGYQVFKNANIEIHARPSAKNQNISRVYDPALDRVVSLTKDEMDTLYSTNGTYAKLRRPTDINGEVVEHMIVRNTPTEYLRGLRDNDTVLNYREGYYQLQYAAPRFIDEITTTANGTRMRKAIAVAKDTPEGERFAQRMRTTNPNNEYQVRADGRALQRGSDDWWDVNSAAGRVAQRHRGKTLETGSGINHLGDGSYILDPATSATRAAKSISGRTVARPMLDAGKARFMSQYGDLLVSDGFGGKRFPQSISEIGRKGGVVSKDVADARTTWGYLRYLENGYINGMDNLYKQFLHALSDRLGRKGFGALERTALLASEYAPTSLAKGGVFQAYIGLNPLRQAFVQAHQAARIWGYNPVGMLNGEVFKYSSSYISGVVHGGHGAGVITKSDGVAFSKFVEESGMIHAVDRHNMVRGFLEDAADNSNRVLAGAGKVARFSQEIGFNVGERFNSLGHLAAAYERYKRMGKDMSNPDVRAAAHSEARAVGYDMNYAGDMPYNQNSAALLLQFMQVPHKGILQLTNRRIPVDVRMRMAGVDMIMWGAPVGLVSAALGGDILPDDAALREFLVDGLESMLINKALQTLAGNENTKIDFSSLSPNDSSGWAQFFTAMFTGGVEKLITNSPSGQMYSPDGRIGTAIKSTLRFFSLKRDLEETPEQFITVLNDFAKISSGYSNANKAYLMLEAGKSRDKQGRLIDQSATAVEAFAQVLGFGSASQKAMFEASMKSSETSKAYKDEVLQDYKATREHIAKTLETDNPDIESLQRTTAFALSRYGNSPIALKIIQDQLRIDLTDPTSKLLRNMMAAGGIPEASKLKDTFKTAPISEEQRSKILQRIDDFQNVRENKDN